MKKVLKGILIVLLLIIGVVGLIYGKEYIESKRIEHIVKSDDGKEVVESMLKSMDDKALTPEGKIKSYKIDFRLNTTLVRGTRGEKYKTGAMVISPKLDKLVYGEKQ